MLKLLWLSCAILILLWCETVRVPFCSANQLRFLLSPILVQMLPSVLQSRLACMLRDKFIFGLECFIECLKWICSNSFVYFTSYIYTRPLLLICNCNCHEYNRPIEIGILAWACLYVDVASVICSHKYNRISVNQLRLESGTGILEGRLEPVYMSMLTSIVHECATHSFFSLRVILLNCWSQLCEYGNICMILSLLACTYCIHNSHWWCKSDLTPFPFWYLWL